MKKILSPTLLAPYWLFASLSLYLIYVGFEKQNWSEALPWLTRKDLIDFASYVLGASAVFVVMRAALKFTELQTFVIFSISALIITSNTSALFTVALIFLAAISIGTLVGLRKSNSVIHLILIGIGFLGTIIGIFAHFPINYFWFYIFLLATPIAALLYCGIDIKEIKKPLHKYLLTRAINRSPNVIAALTAAIALMHLAGALLPELGFDALAVHLFVPTQVAWSQQWGYDPTTYVWALMPMLGDWLYSISYVVGGESGARLLNLLFLFLLAWLTRETAQWLGASKVFSDISVLILLSTPLSFAESNSLYIDSIWSTFVIAGFLSVFKMADADQGQERSSNYLLHSAFFWGCACATKAVTLVILPIAGCLILLLMITRRLQLSVQHIGLAALLFFLLACVPYVTAWAISGNPVFPFYNELFKSPFFLEWNFNNPIYNSGVQWETFYKIVFDSSKYIEGTTGASGYQWITLFPIALYAILLRRNHKQLAVLGVCILSIMAVFVSQSYLRYIFPLFALFAAVISAGLCSSKAHPDLSTPTPLIVTLLSLTIGLNLVFFCSAGWTYRNMPIELLIDEKQRKAFVELRSPLRTAVSEINRLNSANKPVALFTNSSGAAGLKADALYPSWYNHVFQSRMNAAKNSQQVSQLLSDYGAKYLVLDDLWSDEKTRERIERATVEVTRIRHLVIRKAKM